MRIWVVKKKKKTGFEIEERRCDWKGVFTLVSLGFMESKQKIPWIKTLYPFSTEKARKLGLVLFERSFYTLSFYSQKDFEVFPVKDLEQEEIESKKIRIFLETNAS